MLFVNTRKEYPTINLSYKMSSLNKHIRDLFPNIDTTYRFGIDKIGDKLVLMSHPQGRKIRHNGLGFMTDITFKDFEALNLSDTLLNTIRIKKVLSLKPINANMAEIILEEMVSEPVKETPAAPNLSQALIKYLKKECYNFTCDACKTVFPDGKGLEVHHIIQRNGGKGGSNHTSNLECLCANCHTKKH